MATPDRSIAHLPAMTRFPGERRRVRCLRCKHLLSACTCVAKLPVPETAELSEHDVREVA